MNKEDLQAGLSSFMKGVAILKRKAVTFLEKMMETDRDSYPDEIVQKFQRLIRGIVFEGLMKEMGQEIPENVRQVMTTKQRRHTAYKLLCEKAKEVAKCHLARKQSLIEMAEEEMYNQMGNVHQDYTRHKELVDASHLEAFVVVVMNEWGKIGHINLNPDEDTTTEEFDIWRNSIDDAIEHGIVTMQQIEMLPLQQQSK